MSKKKTYQNPILDEPEWLCVPCQKTFATNYSLRRHMRLIHDAPQTLIEEGDEGVMYGQPVFGEAKTKRKRKR
jgi:hypothetical protein